MDEFDDLRAIAQELLVLAMIEEEMILFYGPWDE